MAEATVSQGAECRIILITFCRQQLDLLVALMLSSH